MAKIRVGIVGVGNCASSLVQGVEFYKDADPNVPIPGLMHVNFGGYHVGDVEFVAAFDVDSKKVGIDLADAIFASENNTMKFADVPQTGVTVLRGRTLDGLGDYYRDTIEESSELEVDVVAELKAARVDVLISYLPVGSEEPINSTHSALSTLVAASLTAYQCLSLPLKNGRRSLKMPACLS